MATKVATTAKTAAKKTSASAPAKAGAKSTVKAVAKAAVKKSSAKKPVDEPSMRFYHSKALREKTFAVLDEIEASPGHPRHGDVMADLVTELIDAGMDYYFMRALKQANVGFVVEQSARMGMSGAVKLISSVNRRFIVRMDKVQLLVVAQHIRELC
jgi:hypothetical protein